MAVQLMELYKGLTSPSSPNPIVGKMSTGNHQFCAATAIPSKSLIQAYIDSTMSLPPSALLLSPRRADGRRKSYPFGGGGSSSNLTSASALSPPANLQLPLYHHKNGVNQFSTIKPSTSTNHADNKKRAPPKSSTMPNMSNNENSQQNVESTAKSKAAILRERRLRRRTLATIEEGKPLGRVSPERRMKDRGGGFSSANGGRLIRSLDLKAPRGTTSVYLNRKPGIQNLGLGIAGLIVVIYVEGGKDKECPPIISCLRAGSIAHRSDGIQVGDFLVGVNGIRIDHLSHEEILTLLRNSGDSVCLALEYSLYDMYFDRPNNTYCKQTDLSLTKDADHEEGSSFGFTIRGGSYGPDHSKSRSITVTNIRPGGPADREGRLRVGDRVMCIEGQDLQSATLHSTNRLIQRQRQSLQMTIQYDVSILETIKSARGPLLLEIDKPAGVELGLVLCLRGERGSMRKHVIIQDITPASIADRCGALGVGDELLSIDGITLDYTTLPEANQLLKGTQPNGLIKLEVLPHLQVLDRANSLYSVVNKSNNHPTSTSNINSSFSSKNQSSAIQDGCSEPEIQGRRRSSQAHQRRNRHSQAASVDPPLLRGNSQHYQYSNQQGSGSNNGQNGRRYASSNGRDRSYERQSLSSSNRHHPGSVQYAHPHSAAALPSSSNPYRPPSAPSIAHHFSSTPNLQEQETNDSSNGRAGKLQLTSYHKKDDRSRSGAGREELQHYYHHQQHQNRHFYPQHGSLSASVSGVPCGQVCHSEVMEVVLHSWAKGGFGLILHRSQPINDHSRSPIFISYIERGSPAEKSGVLQVGDRILAINDWCTSNGTADEANYIIRHATSPLSLTVEFDVIETVLPSSGVFTVKLAKRGQNLGVVIRSDGLGGKGEAVLVTDIRTGSVAHRCGSIQPGDQLLAIDNIPLDTCTVEESVRLLQRSSDIVKLRIKKRSSQNADEADSQVQTVVYSVELSRRGGPLGITIASTDEKGDPIIISQLAMGGLAERTGALHIGDRIMAINGTDLSGRRVGEAMEMLQAASDSVNLKIARCVEPAMTHTHPRGYSTTLIDSSSMLLHQDAGKHQQRGTPVQSIDSAVESLEDSPIGPQRIQTSSAVVTDPSSSKYGEELSLELQRSLECSGPHQQHQHQRGSGGDDGSDGGRGVGAGSGQQNSGGSLSGGDSGIGSSEPDPFCGCSCQNSTSSPHSLNALNNQTQPSASHPPNSTANESMQENWMRVLEALETVGEEEMLKKLEESIMSGAVPSGTSGTAMGGLGNNVGQGGSGLDKPSGSSLLNPPFPTTNTILRHPHMNHPNATSNNHPNGGVGNHSGARNSAGSFFSESSGSLSSGDSGTHHHNHSHHHSHLLSLHPPPKPPHPAGSGNTNATNMMIQASDNIPYSPSAAAAAARTVGSGNILSPPPANMPSPGSSNKKEVGSVSPSCSSIQLSSIGSVTPVMMMSNSMAVAEATDAQQASTSSAPAGHQIMMNSPQQQMMLNSPQQQPSTSSGSQPQQQQVFRVSLHKDTDYNDYGFSVSDGVNKEGVYINKIRPGGPAHRLNVILPFDRILQVNDQWVQKLDCMLTVPLLLSSSDRIELLLSRDPTNNLLVRGGAGGMAEESITEEEEDSESLPPPILDDHPSQQLLNLPLQTQL